MLDFELNGCEFETHRRNCVVPLSQIGGHWVSPENDGSFGEGGVFNQWADPEIIVRGVQVWPICPSPLDPPMFNILP